jgi:histone acetyltransferase 1
MVFLYYFLISCERLSTPKLSLKNQAINMTDTLEKQVAECEFVLFSGIARSLTILGSSDANDAVEIALIDRDGTELATFHPRFTYPIFGEEETIFGYKDLSIKISFVADVLKPLAEISYAEKFKPVGDVKAADVKSILQDFLPSGTFLPSLQNLRPIVPAEAFVARTKYDEQLQGLDSTFAPPGRLVHSFTRGGKDYEIWCAELANDEPKNLLGRIQIMTSFYIEGGVPLDLEEEGWSRERWRVFFVYVLEGIMPPLLMA